LHLWSFAVYNNWTFLVSFGLIASEGVGIIPVERTDWEGKGTKTIAVLWLTLKLFSTSTQCN
jgi:hypothetical protein